METRRISCKAILRKAQPRNRCSMGKKPFIKLKVEAVLTHMVMEDMVHYGELSAVLWQMGLEAPYKAYWRYKYHNP